jgi:hypothetical protein
MFYKLVAILTAIVSLSLVFPTPAVNAILGIITIVVAAVWTAGSARRYSARARQRRTKGLTCRTKLSP